MNGESSLSMTSLGDAIQCIAFVFFFVGVGISLFLAFAFGIENCSSWGTATMKFHAGPFFAILCSGIALTSMLFLFFLDFGELVSNSSGQEE